MQDLAAQKYFKRWTEQESLTALSLLQKNSKLEAYDYVLCIPAYDESFDSLFSLLNATFEPARLLFILNINEPCFEKNQQNIASGHIEDIQAASNRTQRLFSNLLSYFPLIARSGPLYYLNINKTRDVLVIRSLEENAILYHQGVGLARKTANDIAALLCGHNLVKTPILFNTDADATLPPDYFARVKYRKEISAWIYPFTHRPCPLATLYQQSLEHYVQGLRFAGSPYAFHTIGSTLALNVDSYIKARGYPKRNAGEDFYLLNKLAKLGNIYSLPDPQLVLSSRLSHRVPFGTGPSLKSLETLEEQATIFYHPDCFKILREFIEYWLVDEQNSQVKPLLQKLNRNFDATLKLGTLKAKQKEGLISDSRYKRIFHERFDAAQTMKLIHFLKDHHYPSLKLAQLQDLNWRLSTTKLNETMIQSDDR